MNDTVSRWTEGTISNGEALALLQQQRLDLIAAENNVVGRILAEEAALAEGRRVPLRAAEVEWVVDNTGDLGVLIHGQLFTLYKGESLYHNGPATDAEGAKQYRPVGKREFGESCTSPTYDMLYQAAVRDCGRHRCDDAILGAQHAFVEETVGYGGAGWQPIPKAAPEIQAERDACLTGMVETGYGGKKP